MRSATTAWCPVRQAQLDQIFLRGDDARDVAEAVAPGAKIVDVLPAIGMMVGIGPKRNNLGPETGERLTKGVRVADAGESRDFLVVQGRDRFGILVAIKKRDGTMATFGDGNAASDASDARRRLRERSSVVTWSQRGQHDHAGTAQARRRFAQRPRGNRWPYPQGQVASIKTTSRSRPSRRC